MRSASISLRAGRIVLGLWLGVGLAAQDDAAPPAHESFVTVDGSRFLLVPTRGTPIVHWAMFVAAGVLEDPVGLEGLSFAVARAALAGPASIGSLDRQREQRALAALDELEQEIARTILAKGAAATELLARRSRAAADAAALADPLAWERELRAAPALGVELRQLTDGILLQIGTRVSGLANVAQLLHRLREEPILRGVHEEFRAVRAELAQRRAASSAARRELLALSYLGHPYSRAQIETGPPGVLSRSVALEVFARTWHPTRTYHVLAGGFETAELRTLLEQVFRTTQLTAPAAVPAPPLPAQLMTRRSTIRGGAPSGLTIGYRLDPGRDETTLAVLVEWLAGRDDSELATRLRLRGHPRITVRAQAPFPGRAAAGLLLLEVADAGGTPARPASALLPDVDAALAAALSEAPSQAAIEQAAARVGTRVRAQWLGPASLASVLAIRCGLERAEPQRALRPPPIPTAADILAFGRRLLTDERRTVVIVENAP
jgi:predicted Zn-dependent peptidase